MSEIEKAIEANATEKVEDNKSDIDAQELDEVVTVMDVMKPTVGYCR